MAEIRAKSGVPVAADFAGSGAPTMCAPVVVDSATGFIYTLKTGDVVVAAGAASSGTVSSVAGSGGTTGLSFTGSPVTTTGTLTLTGTLAVANGGTGITSFAAGVATWFGSATAANLRTAVNGTTGTAGNLVFSGAPSFGTTIGVGNASAAGTGAGVTFPATQSVSSDANTLDDYERGNWTPTDGSGAALSLTINNATYTKIGRLVFARAYITYPATADVSAAVIASLPFTNANFNVAACQTNSGIVVIAQVDAAATTLKLRNGTTDASVTNLQMTGKYLIFSAVYEI